MQASTRNAKRHGPRRQIWTLKMQGRRKEGQKKQQPLQPLLLRGQGLLFYFEHGRCGWQDDGLSNSSYLDRCTVILWIASMRPMWLRGWRASMSNDATCKTLVKFQPNTPSISVHQRIVVICTVNIPCISCIVVLLVNNNGLHSSLSIRPQDSNIKIA